MAAWDIFCRVVDNLGDAGVCWRLARQLVAEHGFSVRLWIDDLASLSRLRPHIADTYRQSVDGVDVCRWPETFARVTPANVVVEAFGCGLPDDYVASMAGASRNPLWIVLEYLSAESWVPSHHGLPSPHPRVSLERYYFFPGFADGTGGLLRESDLFARRDAFDAARRAALWRSIGYAPPQDDAIVVSVFAYAHAPLGELLECWEHGERDIVAAIPESALLESAARYLGAAACSAGSVMRRGRLEIRAVPFVPQAQYDELLWSCDCNFVRGEDSFVRAQWAGKPFVWQIYPQQERAHWRKLEAFLVLYESGMPPQTRVAAPLMRLWNQIEVPGVTTASAWAAYAAALEPLREYGAAWAARIAGVGGLADNLVRFCAPKLKSG